ncbi:hypothetical protein E3983_04410 [Legionella israelensis]|uniref:Uncharacterized protein n=1 Tax=Legionella israelensis TaxID=454 RepID=A0AAX1EFN4_9GAMM|nr:hypothetical protein [Legionella israelensis]QBR83667.1 hypothetical protein E3983_04410 [Legionella israelensis]
MKVDKIIEYIEDFIANKLNKKSDIESLEFHLYVIKSILKESKVGGTEENIAKIHEALHYIEGIKIQTKPSFFSDGKLTTMEELLLSHGEVLLPEHDKSFLPLTVLHYNPAPLPEKHHKIFGTIHASLRFYFKEHLQYERDESNLKSNKFPKAAWSFSYLPEEDEEEILNQPIGKWQNLLMMLSDTPKKAYVDFTRDTSILGMVGKTEKDVDRLLDYLIFLSDYKEEDKAMLMGWLQNNGGQENNRFIDLLLMSGEYTHGVLTDNCYSQCLLMDWCIENGKIVFNCDVISYTVQINGELKANDKGSLIVIEPEEMKTRSTPILRFQAKIQLELTEDNLLVKPTMVNLNVTSFTNDLFLPEKKPTVTSTL